MPQSSLTLTHTLTHIHTRIHTHIHTHTHTHTLTIDSFLYSHNFQIISIFIEEGCLFIYFLNNVLFYVLQEHVTIHVTPLQSQEHAFKPLFYFCVNISLNCVCLQTWGRHCSFLGCVRCCSYSAVQTQHSKCLSHWLWPKWWPSGP